MPSLPSFQRVTTSVFAALVAAIALAGPALASTLPPPVVDADYKLQRVGAGKLSWLGQPIYDASLWTAQGRFTGYAKDEPVALSLWYQRHFSRDTLLRITDTAWKRLGNLPAERRERWLASLRAFWSDVHPGDNVTTVVVPGRATRFYNDKTFMGEIDDPEFGPAFLSIWLDTRSVVADLRVQLLGLDRGTARR